jgi:N12 class adenine-specific DNA methylase
MSSSNTLLAHRVGAGTTFTMVATGMKMKQAGLIQKPMYVVPNPPAGTVLAQFMQLWTPEVRQWPNERTLARGMVPLHLGMLWVV